MRFQKNDLDKDVQKKVSIRRCLEIKYSKQHLKNIKQFDHCWYAMKQIRQN